MKRKIKKKQFIIVFICIALLSIGCRVDNFDEESTENIDDSGKRETEEIKKGNLEETLPETLNISKDELNYIVDEAIEICFMFNIGINYDYNSIVEVDGVQWGKVTESKFRSMKELEEYLLSVFVDKTVYEEYNIDQTFQEIDGELFTNRLGEMGTLIRYNVDSPELERVREQEKMLVFRKGYYEGDYEIQQFIEIEVVYDENKGFRLNSTINTY